MKIPYCQNQIGYVSSYKGYIGQKNISRGVHGFFMVNDIFEGVKGYTKMTWAEFKLRYPIESESHIAMRYREYKYM